MTKIENKAQYRWALNRVEEILPFVKDDTPLSNPYSIELELLSGLVADYSDQYYAIGSPSLADMQDSSFSRRPVTVRSKMSDSELADLIRRQREEHPEEFEARSGISNSPSPKDQCSSSVCEIISKWL